MTRSRFLFIAGVIGLLVLAAIGLRSSGQSAGIVGASMLATTLGVATPITLGMLAGLFCERSGVVNIGIEGMMLAAAFFGYTAAAATQSLLVGMLAALASGALLSLLHAWLSVTLKVDQIISGTAINILAVGLTGYLNDLLLHEDPLVSAGVLPTIAELAELPVLGLIFVPLRELAELSVVGLIFNQKPLVWGTIALVLLVHYVLFFTTWGLRTRAVGEHPRAADVVGIDVYRMRYANVIIGGMLAGLGGAYFTLESTPSFEPLLTSGRGFIALAALIFGGWTPLGGWAAALLFGAASAFQSNAQQFGIPVPSQIIGMVPYLLTIVILAGVVGRATPPAAVGQPYDKD